MRTVVTKSATMPALPAALVTGVLAVFLMSDVAAGTTTTNTDHFDAAFRKFLRDNGYPGGTVAALKDGRLVLAKSYGVTREGMEVKVGSRFPVSALSQSLTAVSILRLVQQGLLGLDDKVFGRQGLLHALRPLHGSLGDPRLQDITVGHLLRHSAGWDSSVAPLFDPVLNEVYQSRGHAVPDIAKVMDVPTPLNFDALIRYVLSQPLHYTPGTRVVPSNLGYLVLGRVVEQASGLMYEDYVKKFVLNPCGMWHTRLDNPATLHPSHHLEDDVPPEDTPELERKLLGGQEPDLMDMLDPRSVDAALGWYSTVHDMARFARCVFDGDEVLDDASLEVLLQRQESAPVQHADSWQCAGFRTNTRGAVWQDGDPHASDVLLHHNLLAAGKSRTSVPDTWVVFLHGSRLHHLRHSTRQLMKELGPLLQDKLATNHFLRDLSDINAASVSDNVLVKFRVDEHHLDAYLSAVKEENYNVRWVSPYTHQRHTYFAIISRLIVSTLEAEVDFKVVHGLREEQLPSRKLHMERHGYNLTFLQSYSSQSHEDIYSFLAVFRKHAYPVDTQLKYGTDHLPEPYDKLVQMYHEQRFHPLVQSVLPHAQDKEEHVSFIFLHTPHSKPVDFKNYYRLVDTKLSKAILHNANRGRTMTYLDAYQLQGKTRFAAVFTNETHPRWFFEDGLSQGQAALVMESRLPHGLWPSLLVAHASKDSQQLQFSVFLRSDEDVPRAESFPEEHPHHPREVPGPPESAVKDGGDQRGEK